MNLQKSITSKGLLCLLTLFLIVNYESQAQESAPNAAPQSIDPNLSPRQKYAALMSEAHKARLNQHYSKYYKATLGVVATDASGPLAAHLTNGAPDWWTGVGTNLDGNPGYGVVIMHVAPGSPADKAGLMKYDIILSFGKHRLASVRQLNALLAKAEPGQNVTLSVIQVGEKGAVSKVNVTLGWAERINAPAGGNPPRTFTPQFPNAANFGNDDEYLANPKAPMQYQYAAPYEYAPKLNSSMPMDFEGSLSDK
ncbi:serine endoprotease [Gimesia chilikensis]|nr:serine endoprotease [Gimesia chilikensis]